MDSKIKAILNVVVVVAVIIWLLQAFGLLHSLQGNDHPCRSGRLSTPSPGPGATANSIARRIQNEESPSWAFEAHALQCGLAGHPASPLACEVDEHVRERLPVLWQDGDFSEVGELVNQEPELELRDLDALVCDRRLDPRARRGVARLLQPAMDLALRARITHSTEKDG